MNLILAVLILLYIIFNEYRNSKKTIKNNKKLKSMEIEMKSMLNTKIRFKRGLRKNLPSYAEQGEPLYCIDTGEMYIGNGENIPYTKVQSIIVRPITDNPDESDFKELTINTETNEIV